MGKEFGKSSMRTGEPLHAVLKRDFEAGKKLYGVSAESVGSDFELGPDAVYKLVNEGAGRLPRWMKALVDWFHATGGLEALKWVAAQCGCIVIPKPTGHRMEGTTAKVLNEVGDLLNQIGFALEDGHMSEEDADRIEKEGNEAIVAIVAAMAQSREMAARNGRATSLKAAHN